MSADTMPPRSGAVLAGRYRLDERLGEGGAGEVWRAVDRSLGRHVAVKLLRPQATDGQTRERFRREAVAAAALAHGNTVTVYDVGTDEDGGDYLVMELVEGAGLDDLLDDGAIPAGAAVSLCLQAAEALGAAHAHGLVHRDVKPANLLVSRHGVVKVADFGIAKATAPDAEPLTQDGTVVGTAAYLAPEQLRDDDVGPSADVYALGLVLHEALSGQRVFGGGTATEVASRRLAGDAPPLPSDLDAVDDTIAAVVARATRLDPAQRYPDGGALADALRALDCADDAALGELARGRVADPANETRIIDVDQAATRAVSAVPADDRNTSQESTAGSDDTLVLPEMSATPPDGIGVDRAGGNRRRPIAAVVAVVAATILAVVLAGLASTGGGGPDDDAPAPEVAIVRATDFDPLGGDGEHPEDVSRAFDDDPSTAWTTQHYNTADFGGLKSGVGLLIETGSTGPVGALDLDLGIDGVDVELRVFDDRPSGDPGSWDPPVARIEGARGRVTLTLEQPEPARYWLVWFTSLGPDGGRFAAEVNEAELRGRR